MPDSVEALMRPAALKGFLFVAVAKMAAVELSAANFCCVKMRIADSEMSTDAPLQR